MHVVPPVVPGHSLRPVQQQDVSGGQVGNISDHTRGLWGVEGAGWGGGSGYELQWGPLLTQQVLLGGGGVLVAVGTAEERLVRPAVQVLQHHLGQAVGGGVQAVVLVSVGGKHSVQVGNQTRGELEN